MGQKTNPIGLRLGVIKGWDSNWFGGKDFSAKLVEDDKIRRRQESNRDKEMLKSRRNGSQTQVEQPSLLG